MKFVISLCCDMLCIFSLGLVQSWFPAFVELSWKSTIKNPKEMPGSPFFASGVLRQESMASLLSSSHPMSSFIKAGLTWQSLIPIIPCHLRQPTVASNGAPLKWPVKPELLISISCSEASQRSDVSSLTSQDRSDSDILSGSFLLRWYTMSCTLGESQERCCG